MWALLFGVNLPGAAVVAGCMDGTVLAGAGPRSWDALTSCVPRVVVVSDFMLFLVGMKPVICCLGLFLGINGS